MTSPNHFIPSLQLCGSQSSPSFFCRFSDLHCYIRSFLLGFLLPHVWSVFSTCNPDGKFCSFTGLQAKSAHTQYLGMQKALLKSWGSHSKSFKVLGSDPGPLQSSLATLSWMFPLRPFLMQYQSPPPSHFSDVSFLSEGTKHFQSLSHAEQIQGTFCSWPLLLPKSLSKCFPKQRQVLSKEDFLEPTVRKIISPSLYLTVFMSVLPLGLN